MIHSHLTYCINIYSCANSTSLNKLRLKQKEAIRNITNSGYRDHTSPLCAQLKILSLDQLFKYNALKFMHCYHHNALPIAFHQMWLLNRERNPDRVLRNAGQLYVPPHHFATLKRMPLFNFPSLWNQEDNVKQNPIQHQYLKNLKSRCLAVV
jgi:hypothetical protein